MKKPPATMPMAVLEDRSGCTRDTIHFYIRSGLLHAPHKTSATRAEYDATHLDRLLRIRALRDAGVTLDGIASALDALSKAPLASVHAIGIVLARTTPTPTPPGLRDRMRGDTDPVLDASLRAHHRRALDEATESLDAVARKLAQTVMDAFDPAAPDRAARLLESLTASVTATLSKRIAAHTSAAILASAGRRKRARHP